MKVRLVSTQLKMALDDYKSFEAFRTRMWQCMDKVNPYLETESSAVVVFPEYLGLYLSSIPYYFETARKARSFRAYVEEIAGRDRANIQLRLFGEYAVEVRDFYEGLFADLARQFGVYIVAGSLCLPKMDRSPHRAQLPETETFVTDKSVINNISPVFNRYGRCIGRTAKHHIPNGEDLLIDGVADDEAHPLRTAIGSIGITLCYDGYHHGRIEQMDAQGCQILCQPVYFASPSVRFDGTGDVVPAYEDFIKLIQGRENISFGISSALVGEIFPDRRAEGLSFIACNANLPDDRWQEAVICQAKSPFEEEILTATVALT